LPDAISRVLDISTAKSLGKNRMIADQEERPWETPGEIRRDAEPHRGLLLCGLGMGSLFCALAGVLLSLLWIGLLMPTPKKTYLFGFPSVLANGAGIALAYWTWSAARHDLARIKRHEVMADGEAPTRIARDVATLALVVDLLTAFFCLMLFLFDISVI
jgi:hypothetical protein